MQDVAAEIDGVRGARQSMWRLRLAAIVGLFLLTGCGFSVSISSESGLVVDTSEVITGLRGPTQMAFAPDGRLLVAELNGAEDGGVGQVVLIDHEANASGAVDASAAATVLFGGLDKPTGVAAFGGEVWVMEQDRLSRGSLTGGNLEAVTEGLVNNGRSQGTLTVTPDDSLLYDTSGRKSGSTVTAGSGRLWRVRLTDAGPQTEEIGSGFKHAYAHAVDGDGNIWVAEMTDGRFDGMPAPDEIVKLTEGADHGWPWCVGNNVAVAEYGGGDAACSLVPAPHAILGDGATPTSVVIAPWDPDLLLVALWTRGQVVGVRLDEAGPVEPTVLLDGLSNPQHLLVDGDAVLLSEFGAGRIIRVEPW